MTSSLHTEKATQKPVNHKRALRTVTIISTFGGLLFGYDTGVINGALPYMQDDLGLTPLTEGLVTSSLLFGAAFGALFGGRLADRNGRRKMIMVLAVIFLAGTLACTFAPSTEVMIAARFLLGLAVGGASVTVPVYLAEVSPSARRGRIVTQNELMIVTGQLLAFIFNAYLGNTFGEAGGIWRWMLVIATLPAIALWIGMNFMPESPRWLASMGSFGESLSVLQRIRSQAEAREEFEEVKAMAVEDYKSKMGSWKDLGVPWLRRIFMVGIGLAVIQQITGVNSIMYYGTQILAQSGFGREAALTANIANGIISVLATFAGIWLLGKVGRRKMLITGQVGTTTCPAADRLLLADPARRNRPRLRDPGPDCHLPGVPAGRHLTRHLAYAVRNLPAEDPWPRNGRIGLRPVDRELPGGFWLPAAAGRDGPLQHLLRVCRTGRGRDRVCRQVRPGNEGQEPGRRGALLQECGRRESRTGREPRRLTTRCPAPSVQKSPFDRSKGLFCATLQGFHCGVGRVA